MREAAQRVIATSAQEWSLVASAASFVWEREVSERLMDAADLERLTGKKRYSKQAAWFKANFGIEVVRCTDGSLIMTWAQFDALMARKAGTIGGTAPTVDLCFD